MSYKNITSEEYDRLNKNKNRIFGHLNHQRY